MTGRRDPSTPAADTVQRFLADKGKGDGGASGNYRRDAARELDRFLAWARGDLPDPGNADPADDWDGVVDGGPVRFADLDATVFGDYARFLRTLADPEAYAAYRRLRGEDPDADGGLANGTVLVYYSYVASWADWAHAQGYLDRHYARESEAEDPLPDDDGRRPGDQQAWAPEHRDALSRHVDERAGAAIDAYAGFEVPAADRGDRTDDAVREKYRRRLDAVVACRDRALALVFCYTGFRAAEVLDDPDDDRPGRDGLTWTDVHLDPPGDARPYATVFRKRQTWKDEPLPDPLVGPLERYRRLLDPPEDWPVFTTLHRPSLSAHVTGELAAAGHDDDEIARLREGRHDLLTAADLGLAPPPALTPNGARRVLRRCCEDGDVPVPGDAGYLQPHGGRRGMGEVFVREFGFAAAARFLDNSEQQVRAAYQHIEAAERGRMATAALARTDGRVSGPDDGDAEDRPRR